MKYKEDYYKWFVIDDLYFVSLGIINNKETNNGVTYASANHYGYGILDRPSGTLYNIRGEVNISFELVHKINEVLFVEWYMPLSSIIPNYQWQPFYYWNDLKLLEPVQIYNHYQKNMKIPRTSEIKRIFSHDKR